MRQDIKMLIIATLLQPDNLKIQYLCPFPSIIHYSISSLPSCYEVFFVGFDGRNQGVLSDFYLLRGFLGDCIVILLSHTYISLFEIMLKIYL